MSYANTLEGYERKNRKSGLECLDNIFQGEKFLKHFKNEIDIDLKHIRKAHEYLISKENKSLETLKEVFLLWKMLAPHFAISFPHRYESGHCIYCMKPENITNEELDYILKKLEVENAN